MNKYGIYSFTKNGNARLIATTEAKDSVQAGIDLENFANSMVGVGNWYVTKIEGKVFG
jgi:hypothetical protein